MDTMVTDRRKDREMDEQRNEIAGNGREDEMEIDLGLLFGAMWKGLLRFWWLVIALIVIGAAGFSVFQAVRYEPMYRSSATFTVSTGDSGSGSYSFYYNSSTADQLSRTFPYILNSSFFRSTLMERLGTDTLNGTISAETITDSNVVTMTVESSSAEDAGNILNAALEIYPETARFVLGDIAFNYLDEPETPTAPFNSLSIPRSIVLGGGAGAFVALCFLGITALFRRTARNTEEMKKITSLRCLASVPQVRFKARKKQKNTSMLLWDKKVPYSYRESIRALQVRLEKEMKKTGGKILLVTSTSAEEGKSSLAVNLAEMFAEKGREVLLIDGDLRKQADARMLRLRNNFCLADASKGEKKPDELIRKVHRTPLWFLGGIRPVKQPASALTSRKTMEFIRKMRERMDYIIIDTPPCGMFQDAGILAEQADGILYVVRYDFVPQQKIWEGISSLRGRNARFLGYVFNDYPESVSEYGYGRYGGYGNYGYRKYGYGGYGYGSSRYGRDGYGDMSTAEGGMEESADKERPSETEERTEYD